MGKPTKILQLKICIAIVVTGIWLVRKCLVAEGQNPSRIKYWVWAYRPQIKNSLLCISLLWQTPVTNTVRKHVLRPYRLVNSWDRKVYYVANGTKRRLQKYLLTSMEPVTCVLDGTTYVQ
jgi:hypothetical protein